MLIEIKAKKHFTFCYLNTGGFTVTNRAVVTLQPNWPEIYSGETITLRCDIENGGDTEWEYEWTTSSSYKPQKANDFIIRSASSSHSGEYRCLGRMTSGKSSTEWSDAFTLRLSDCKSYFVSLQNVKKKMLYWSHVLRQAGNPPP